MEENQKYTVARKVPHGLGQHYADVHEMIYEFSKCNEIIDELIGRIANKDKNFSLIEWSLWSAALTLFFKQFSNNDGRKLSIDYKKVFKDQMKHDDYKAYNVFRGIRDGYIAHANNEQNRILPLAIIDESTKDIKGVGFLQCNHDGSEGIGDLKTFKEMINIAGLWCENKQKQIEKALLEYVNKAGYDTVANWERARVVQPTNEQLRTNSRETV